MHWSSRSRHPWSACRGRRWERAAVLQLLSGAQVSGVLVETVTLIVLDPVFQKRNRLGELLSGNEDFAREFHQLFFGILGDPELYGGTEGGGVLIDSHDWLAHRGSVGRPRLGLADHPHRQGSPGGSSRRTTSIDRDTIFPLKRVTRPPRRCEFRSLFQGRRDV